MTMMQGIFLILIGSGSMPGRMLRNCSVRKLLLRQRRRIPLNGRYL